MTKFITLFFLFVFTVLLVLTLSFLIVVFTQKALRKELKSAKKSHILGRGRLSAKQLLLGAFLLVALFPLLTTFLLGSPTIGLLGSVMLLPFIYRFLLKKQYSLHLESVDENSLSFLYALQGLSEVGINLPSALFILADRIDGPFAAELRKSLKKFEDGKSLSELLEAFQKRAGLKLSGVYLNLIDMVYSQGLSVTPLLTKMVPLLEMESSANQKIRNLRKSSAAQICMAFCIPWVVMLSLVYFQGDLIHRFLSNANGYLVIFIAILTEVIGSLVIWNVSKFY